MIWLVKEKIDFTMFLNTTPARRSALRFEKEVSRAFAISDVNRPATAAQAKRFDGIVKKARGSMLFLGLSIMFFGQQLQRTAEGLLRPAAELVGIFDIFGVTLELLFLPVMLALLPLFIGLLDVVSSMPDWLKLLIGAFMVFVFVLGGILATAGQLLTLGAGLAGMDTALIGMPATIATVKNALGGGRLGLIGALGLFVVALGIVAAAAVRGANVAKNAWEKDIGGVPIVGGAVSNAIAGTRDFIEKDVLKPAGITKEADKMRFAAVALFGAFLGSVIAEQQLSNPDFKDMYDNMDSAQAREAKFGGGTSTNTVFNVDNMNLTSGSATEPGDQPLEFTKQDVSSNAIGGS